MVQNSVLIHFLNCHFSLCFHPQSRILISGWENGEIHAWIGGKREFLPVQGSGFHKSPIMLIEFSEKGGRLVTADSVSDDNITDQSIYNLTTELLEWNLNRLEMRSAGTVSNNVQS